MKPTVCQTSDFDAIVIGAGFAGINALRKLRDELGLRVRAFDKAPGVGGTWFWNRYPGALSDSRSEIYCYSFDKDLLQEWPLTSRYLTQPQVLAYLEHVVDRYDLRQDIQLNTAVTAAHYDEQTGLWTIATDDGHAYTARFFITAVGVVHKPVLPNIPGRDSFSGVSCHTSLWPEGLDLTGKRVGILGTGSSGTQVLPAVAPIAEHATVFVRSPQYTVPIGNRPLTAEEEQQIKANYDQIWEATYGSITAHGIDTESTAPSALEVSEAERERTFQEAWDRGGPFQFMVGTFNDIVTDPVANEYAASFIRRKIHEIIKNPETARILCPTEPWARRPVADNGFYDAFNRDNVTAVSCRDTPITEIVPSGVRTSDGTIHELDVLVFATGFDGITGAFNNIDIRGRGGRRLADDWKEGAGSHLAVAVAGYPNMFCIFGPYSPFSNNPPLISVEVDFVAGLIKSAREAGAHSIEAQHDAQQAFVAECDELAKATILYDGVDSWVNGGNIPGKPRQILFNMAGLGSYRDRVADEVAAGYPGFHLAHVPGELLTRS